ncbi:unnamed protein product [Pleuronectes platessa]|uniref:Uncharacterized protein n=1 Tax=Pleuronectes platessa TaxID=8262 RepID=A0A9N7VGG3_PLEPL|nr:unnamed protein product [Pleuronectes platessa]
MTQHQRRLTVQCPARGCFIHSSGGQGSNQDHQTAALPPEPQHSSHVTCPDRYRGKRSKSGLMPCVDKQGGQQLSIEGHASYSFLPRHVSCTNNILRLSLRPIIKPLGLLL